MKEVYKSRFKIICDGGLFPIAPTDVWCREERGHKNVHSWRVGQCHILGRKLRYLPTDGDSVTMSGTVLILLINRIV